mmetsp:Transcript_62307/g.148758  ORF Transcript_62307/g.148758 Transcript_62307/m.148758 type:complete len:265 (-) Transcript_62307:126-920(-)
MMWPLGSQVAPHGLKASSMSSGQRLEQADLSTACCHGRVRDGCASVMQHVSLSASNDTAEFLARRFWPMPNTFLNFVPDKIGSDGKKRMRRSRSAPGHIALAEPDDKEQQPQQQYGCEYKSFTSDNNSERCSGEESDVCESELTTVVIRNIPHWITQRVFMRQMNARGLKGCYNFCHLPVDFHSGSAIGYAVVNFIRSDLAAQVVRTWSGSDFLCPRKKMKRLEVIYADFQGIEALTSTTFMNKIMRIRKKGLRPFILGTHVTS